MSSDPSDGRLDARAASWPGKDLGLPREGVGSLAPVLQRVGARFTDGLIFLTLHLLIASGRFLVTGEFHWAEPRASVIAVMALAVVYELTMIALWGQTLGKMYFGIRVVSAPGLEIPGWARSVRRSLLVDGPNFAEVLLGSTFRWLESAAAGVVLIDALWLVRDRNRQSLHDKLAGTVVVCEQRGVEIAQRRKQIKTR